jgi:hypothetical protein
MLYLVWLGRARQDDAVDVPLQLDDRSRAPWSGVTSSIRAM